MILHVGTPLSPLVYCFMFSTFYSHCPHISPRPPPTCTVGGSSLSIFTYRPPRGSGLRLTPPLRAWRDKSLSLPARTPCKLAFACGMIKTILNARGADGGLPVDCVGWGSSGFIFFLLKHVKMSIENSMHCAGRILRPALLSHPSGLRVDTSRVSGGR